MEVVRLDGVTKSYRVGVGRARVREMLPPPVDRRVASLFPRWWSRNTFNALDGVSTSIEAASSLGIVGHNGAGKTTLLKAIARVTAPTSGRVRVKGRIAALIDAVVGFHPDLTGRENVYLLGSMHGFGRKEMATRVESIFEFAEIDEMADTAVKRYSAGMVARLGFATVTALDVDILLVDEILAVGDANFQNKCIRWLDDYHMQGGTLLFVSHNLSLIRNMTERVIWLDHGRLVHDGSTADVLAQYAKAMERRDLEHRVHGKKQTRKAMLAQGAHRWGAGGARVEHVHIDNPSTDGSDLQISISYHAADVNEAVFCVGFVDEGGREIASAASPTVSLSDTAGALRCAIRPLPLRTGIYFPVVAILSPDGLVRDRWRLDRAVVVERNGNGPVEGFGPVQIASAWSVTSPDITDAAEVSRGHAVRNG